LQIEGFDLMRYALFGALFMTLLLSACGGGEPTQDADTPVATPDPNQQQPTTDPASIPTDDGSADAPAGEGLATNPPSIAGLDNPVAVIVTVRPTLENEVPFGGVGTLAAPATEDPNINLPFEWLSLRRLGGIPNPDGSQAEINITIYADGRIVQDGVEGRIPQPAIDLLNLYLREVNFFNVQNTFMGPLGDNDITTFVYTITARRGEEERSLNVMDDFAPSELTRIIGTIYLEGQRITGGS
jgi:hypothetical protein